MISERLQRFKYVLSDLVAVSIGWLSFNYLRFNLAEYKAMISYDTFGGFLSSPPVVLGICIVPLLALSMFWLSGYYNIPFRKSRLQEMTTTILSTLLVSLLTFFLILLNDMLQNSVFNIEVFGWLWLCLFIPTYLFRFVITTHATHKFHNRQWAVNTLVIGNGRDAHKFVKRLNTDSVSLGYHIVGYVDIPGEKAVERNGLPVYQITDLDSIVAEKQIREFLVLPTKSRSRATIDAINQLFPYNLPIKISPDLYHILLTKVNLSNLTGEPLVDVAGDNMTESATNVKRLADVVVSAIALLLLMPVYAVIAIMIKRDSRGDVIYRQERLGYRNKPFNILKFRTMVRDAEADGEPQLSTDDDPRITHIGKILRKYRLDELPQFWNILRGDMSLVGPRPERKFYVDQIMKRAPYYALLHQVRPGLTSLGMVKFGYAKNVDEMLKRLKYDIIYIENMSLINDLKIMVYTIKTVISGKGL